MADVFALFLIVLVVLIAGTGCVCIRAERKELIRLKKQAERKNLQATQKMALDELDAITDYIRKIEAATTAGDLDRLAEERKKRLCSCSC